MNFIKRIKTISHTEAFIFISVAALVLFIIKFFGYREEFATVKIEVIKKNWTENYDPYGYRAPFWLSDKIKPGQTQKNKAGKIVATLLDVENYERGGEEAEIYLTVKIKVLKNTRTGEYTFDDKPINLGSEISLTLNNINIQGQIIDNHVPQTGYPTKYFLVKARGRNINPDVYSKITPGLKMFNRSNNDPIAEITKVNIENPSFQKVTIIDNHLQAISNEYKDIVIEAKIKCYQIDGKWFFSGHQNIKALEGLYIYTDVINLYNFEIEDVQEAF